MKYIKLFEDQENPNYSMYEIITMTPGMAGEVLRYECSEANPDMELIRNILDHSAVDVNQVDRDGFTALILASEFGQTEIVRMLLQKPEIDVNVQDQYGDTALMSASWNGHTEIEDLIKSHPNFKETL